MTTSNAPNNVLIEGISSQIKYPKIIPNTNAKYFKGDTRETSDNLKDWLSHKFATPPNIPIIDSIIKSPKSGIIHPNGIVKTPARVIAAEKFNDISQTGSVEDNFLIAIAT